MITLFKHVPLIYQKTLPQGPLLPINAIIMLIALIIVSNMFVKFNRDTNKNFKTKSTCDQISNLILRQRINDYYRQNPLGPAGRVRGVVYIHKCEEVQHAFSLGEHRDSTPYMQNKNFQDYYAGIGWVQARRCRNVYTRTYARL